MRNLTIQPDQSWHALVAAQVAQADRPDDWRIVVPHTPTSWWIELTHVRAALPAQGWKLHLSASVASAQTMLERVLPLLLAEDAGFKLIASLHRLHALNTGLGSLSQIGKCITIYPNDDRQAVRLATLLDAATRDLRGPTISSDRPLTSGSRVFYRYGAFAHQWVQTDDGVLHPAIRTPSAELIPDPREAGYRPPAWAIDPFIAAGIADVPPSAEPLLLRRYLVIELLAHGPSGAVARALDMQTADLVVLKRAARDAGMTLEGVDARDRLRHEAALLQRLAPSPHVPAVLDLFALGDDLCLVLADMAGETLARTVKQTIERGVALSGAQVIDWGRKLVASVAALHKQGVIHRDLKSTNVIVTPDQQIRLIDFETAYDTHAPTQPHGLATRGYQSPQQRAGATPTPSDDLYSVGALLYLLATGAEPGFAPDPANLLTRPIVLLNPAIAPALSAIIARCLAPEPAQRFRSMAALDDALAAIAEQAEVEPPHFGSELEPFDVAPCQIHYGALARQLGDKLCRAMQPVETAASGGQSRALHDGSSGQILALAEIVAAYRDPTHEATLIESAQRLDATAPPAGALVTGLYTGEAGVAAALLRAGQVLGDDRLLQSAARRGYALADQPHQALALFNGSAGRLRLHLWLWDALNDPQQLAAARAAGTWIIASAQVDDADGLFWSVPDRGGQARNKALCGYALGTAGIADALIELYAATGDQRSLLAARSASRWLVRQARPALADGTGLTWPEHAGGENAGCTWRQGATGIARFLLRAGTYDDPAATEAAVRAAWFVTRGARAAGPDQASGLAGSIELLLDMAQTTGDRRYLGEAYALARLLETFLEEPPVVPAFSLAALTQLAPTYLTGYAGIALCLMRLAAPTTRPHQLSRQGFRGRSEPDSSADRTQAAARHGPPSPAPVPAAH